MSERGKRKTFVGTVIRDKMDKTAVVEVIKIKKHKKYHKYIRDRVRYMAHDPQNKCEVGDRVKIIETRPISKRKRWQVISIIEKSVAKGSDLPEDNVDQEQLK